MVYLSGLKITRREFLKISATSLLGAYSSSLLRKYGIDAFNRAKIKPKATRQEFYTTCRVCGQSCPTLVVEVEDGVITYVKHRFPSEELEKFYAACGRPKGGIPGMVYNPDRLKYPLIRVGGTRGNPEFRRATWDEALDLIAQKLKEYRDQGHPEYVAAFVHLVHSGGFIKNFFKVYGTPNITNHANTCHTDRDAAMKAFFGKHIGPGGFFTDYLNAKLVVISSRNPLGGIVASTWTKMFSEGIKRGMKVIVIDPRYSEVAEVADLWVPIKPGTDLALFLALIHLIIKNKYYDEDFLKTYTNAPMLIDVETMEPVETREITEGDWAGKIDYLVYDNATGTFKFKKEAADPALDFTGEYNGKTVKTAFTLLKERIQQYTPEWASNITGVPVETINYIADELNKYKPQACIDHGYKASRWMNTRRTWHALMLVNILLGAFGRPGGINWARKVKVPCSISGKPTAQSVFDYWESEYPLHKKGNNPSLVIKTILEEKPYPIKAAIIWNQNVLAGTAGYSLIKKALEKLEFVVYIDIMPSETMYYADVVLPQATFVEQDSMSLMATSKTPLPSIGVMRKIIDPMFEAKSEFWIINELAKRVLSPEEYAATYGVYNNEREIWQWQVSKLKEKYSDLDYNTLVSKGVYVSGTSPKYEVYKGGKPLNTKTGEIELYSLEYLELYKSYNNDPSLDPLPNWIPPRWIEMKQQLDDDEFVLIEARAPLHTNQGFTRDVPMLINVMRRYLDVEYVMMNRARAEKLGLKDGDIIEITNPETGVSLRAKVKVTELVHPDALFGYYGMVVGPDLPENEYTKLTFAPRYGINTNFLAPFHLSPRSAGVAAQDFIVKVKKIG